jgi:hypothetical protein
MLVSVNEHPKNAVNADSAQFVSGGDLFQKSLVESSRKFWSGERPLGVLHWTGIALLYIGAGGFALTFGLRPIYILASLAVVTLFLSVGSRCARRLSKRQANVAGWLAVACLVFMWLEMLVPNTMDRRFPVFGRIGPFYWLLPLAMILLPLIAAIRGSKWWLSVTVAGVVTLGAFLSILLD